MKKSKKATIIIKRQYTGNRDMEKAFTDIFTRALIKMPPPKSVKLPPRVPTIPCVPKLL
ncbi:MAG: hypothetical protein FWF79_01450 [Defluviitaleaceae bacterium]|nr:hypothetical protein [Defluviitaleaceae bacterium]